MKPPNDPSTKQRWNEIQDLFDSVVELGPDQRTHRLDQACAGDRELRRMVESLIGGHDRSDEVLYDLEHPEAIGEEPSGNGGTDPHHLIGRTIAHYRVVERLGGGGMGVVYRAEDLRLGRIVALKFLPPGHCRDAQVIRRFRQEAQVASSLDHPNICTVHQIAESDDGGLFIVMSHYPGESLKELLARGPIARERVLDLAIQVAGGLAAVHREGLIHRDIKPANLMVTEDGTIKILDFGLAKVPDVTLTQSGRTMGTVAYMSPEQVRSEDVDARTDLWSLGVVLFEAITGQRPFRGEREASVIYAIINQEPDPPRTVDADSADPLEQVVLRLLRKDPRERYSDAGVLLADLEALRAGRGPPGVAHVPAGLRRSRRRTRLVMAAAMILAVAAAIWGARTLVPEPVPPATAGRLSTIAVLPFTVDGTPDLEFLGEGMVKLLAVKIDARGQLRSVTPRVLVDHINRMPSDQRDPGKYHRGVPGGGWAADLADQFLAEHFIVGAVSDSGDGIRLSATLYSPRWWDPVAESHVTVGSGGDLIGAIDRLADGLLGRVPGVGAADNRTAGLAELTTGSVPALRAFLAGRRAYRKGKTADANEMMRQAVDLDSTFALAWFDLAFHRRFFGRGADLTRAISLQDDLPPRQQQHLAALQTVLDGRAPDAERMYRELLAQYPDDIDAWDMLGDILARYGGFYGRPSEDSREVFERALGLDPDELRSTYRLLDIAGAEGRLTVFDSIAKRIADLEPPGSEDERLYSILPRLTGANPSERAVVWAELEADATEGLLNGITYYARWLGDVKTLLWRYGLMAAHANPPAVQDRGHHNLALLETAGGRFATAEHHLDALTEFNPGWALVLRATIAALPHSPYSAKALADLRSQVAQWDTLSQPLSADTHIGGWADLTAYLQGLLSFRLGDEAATRVFADRLAERGASQDRGIPAAQMSSTLAALLAWRRGEPEQALAALDDAVVDLRLILRDSPFHSQTLNRFVRGEVLYSQGRYQEALPWFESINRRVDDDFIWLYFAPAQRRIAEIHERLGNTGAARNNYRRFLDLWGDSDPALHPTVVAAASRLHSLTAGATAD